MIKIVNNDSLPNDGMLDATCCTIMAKGGGSFMKEVGVAVRLPDRCDRAEWWRTLTLMNAAPDLQQALRDLMDDYACHLGVPVEACDKGNFAQAWAALRKAEGTA